MQVMRIVFMIGMKAMREGKLGRERVRDRALEKLSLALRARLRDRARSGRSSKCRSCDHRPRSVLRPLANRELRA
jgi:hypothetical protein